jgi:MoaA/NifB/PqqE/SkfB family radical SAM enzyme
VLELSARCDQACAQCDIWRGASAAGPELGLAERLRVVDDALAAGVGEALLTGGEPLLSVDVWPVAGRLRAGGARVMLSTNGMGLERHAALVARLFQEVYVSLDGPDAASHDGLRGGASFARLAAGIAALRRHSPRPRLVARSVVHARNVDGLADIVSAARRLGADHVSFLPVDASSQGFGGRPETRRALVPSEAQVRRLEQTISRLEDDGFVLENADKLRRLARHLAASGGRSSFERPRCDAPRWSAVVTADGGVKPCFFHAPVGDVRAGITPTRRSREYRAAVQRIEAPNDTCARCVCPKWRGPAWRRMFQ